MDGTPTLSPFDPVVTRVITDDASIPRRETEPAYDIAEWRPPVWDTINTVRTPDGIDQRLVVIPAQYRATSGFLGSERLFTVMTYTLYYSDTRDTLPPRIWSVRDLYYCEPKLSIQVQVTDFSGVAGVVVAYTTGDGIWQTSV